MASIFMFMFQENFLVYEERCKLLYPQYFHMMIQPIAIFRSVIPIIYFFIYELTEEFYRMEVSLHVKGVST